jgi:hypothetical protein
MLSHSIKRCSAEKFLACWRLKLKTATAANLQQADFMQESSHGLVIFNFFAL